MLAVSVFKAVRKFLANVEKLLGTECIAVLMYTLVCEHFS